MTGGRIVTVKRHFAAAADEVFNAWLDPKRAGRWLFRTNDGELERCEIDARVGGGFTIVERRGGEAAEHFGDYVELDPPRGLAFDFWTSFSDEKSRVEVTIAAEGEGARITLVHEGVWPDYEARTRQGWTKILDGLAGEVETRR